MLFQADMLEAAISISNIEEASALGAVIMNGFARKVWKDFEEVSALRNSDRYVRPQMNADEVCSLFDQWHDAVRKVMIN